MKRDSRGTRLQALDGLRGLAILLVLLNHLPFNSRPTPYIPWVVSDYINRSVFGSGRIGVQSFFILSGFLIVYLYLTPNSKLGFIQRRYTRILPLFLTMCVVGITIDTWGSAAPLLYLGITILVALVAHIGWVYVVKRHFSESFKRLIFVTFLVVQGIVGIIYAIATLMRGGAPFIWAYPPIIENVARFLINASLTFQFGTSGLSLYWGSILESGA